MTTFASAIGTPPAVQFIAVEQLRVDAAYQRALDSKGSTRLVASIAASWDWRLCVPLLVAQRADGLYILDGQHRWAAARMRGDIPHLPCAVGQFDGVAAEAALFVAANKRRVPVSRVDLFRAAIVAGDREAVEIGQLLTDAGLKLARHVNPREFAAGEIACTHILRMSLRTYGRVIVGAALTQMGEAFKDQVIPVAAPLFGAIVSILRDEHCDGDVLAEALATMTAEEWGGLVDGVGEGGQQRINLIRAEILAAMAMLTPQDPEQREEAA